MKTDADLHQLSARLICATSRLDPDKPWNVQGVEIGPSWKVVASNSPFMPAILAVLHSEFGRAAAATSSSFDARLRKATRHLLDAVKPFSDEAARWDDQRSGSPDASDDTEIRAPLGRLRELLRAEEALRALDAQGDAVTAPSEDDFVRATLVETDYDVGWREGRDALQEMVDEALSSIEGHEQAVMDAQGETLKVELFLAKVMEVVTLAASPDVKAVASAAVMTPENRQAILNLQAAAARFVDGEVTIETVNKDVVDQMMIATKIDRGEIWLKDLIADAIRDRMDEPLPSPDELAGYIAKTVIEIDMGSADGV